jgi:hypothetical protein
MTHYSRYESGTWRPRDDLRGVDVADAVRLDPEHFDPAVETACEEQSLSGAAVRRAVKAALTVLN